MLTNRLGLPDGVVRAVQNDPYTRGDSDISVTQLITPPFQRKLKESTEPVEDVSDRIWSLLGQATHTILERAYPLRAAGRIYFNLAERYAAEGHLLEERLYHTVNGIRVSGAFDVYEGGTIFDYKVTSAWSVLGETKIEWEHQLNLLRYLAFKNGLTDVRELRIIAILRDWQKMKARTDKAYPQAQVVPVDIPVWSLADAEAFLMERLEAHFADNPPPCSDAERWKTPNVYAVMKKGRKSAVKLHDTSGAADLHAASLGKDHSVTYRPGEYKRCGDYCNVSHACPVWTGEVPF